MKRIVVALGLSVVASLAAAQSPYAGMQTRPIKALSDEQIADLKAGRGMGLALPAELNGYPGPSHVLELADKLSLSDEQIARIRGLFESMRAEAIPLGSKLLEQEGALNHQFAARFITAASLQTLTAEIGLTQAELRNAHLKYHLLTADILSSDQMQRYASLRGYGTEAPNHRRHHR